MPSRLILMQLMHWTRIISCRLINWHSYLIDHYPFFMLSVISYFNVFNKIYNSLLLNAVVIHVSLCWFIYEFFNSSLQCWTWHSNVLIPIKVMPDRDFPKEYKPKTIDNLYELYDMRGQQYHRYQLFIINQLPGIEHASPPLKRVLSSLIALYYFFWELHQLLT